MAMFRKAQRKGWQWLKTMAQAPEAVRRSWLAQENVQEVLMPLRICPVAASQRCWASGSIQRS